MSTTLPVVPKAVLDTSVLQTHQRCPRKAYYQYWLNRSPSGKNYPIGFGLAYHAYREWMERAWIDSGQDLAKDGPVCHSYGVRRAMEVYPDDPPLGHKKEFLTRQRLRDSLEQAYTLWQTEKRQGIFKVLEVEQGFQLAFPNGRLFGGRMDQILEWNGQLWVRDFKTTSRMGATYAKQFDPNDQMTCYTWGASVLSGRKVQGVIIQVIYNTKTKGPEHHQFITTRSPAHIEEWQQNVEREGRLVDEHTAEEYFPMRTTGCSDFNGCFYRDCCGLSSWKQRDAWLRTHTIESHWDFMNPDDEEGVVD